MSSFCRVPNSVPPPALLQRSPLRSRKVDGTADFVLLSAFIVATNNVYLVSIICGGLITIAGPQNAITIARSSGLRGLLISVRSKGQTSAIIPDLSPSVVGTKEYTECSNHGVCNYTTGGAIFL